MKSIALSKKFHLYIDYAHYTVITTEYTELHFVYAV